MVDDLTAQLKKFGYQVKEGPSFGNSCGVGRCNPDIVYQTPDGKISIVEIKTGDVGLSIRQSQIFPQIRNGDAIPRSPALKIFGIRIGIPLKNQRYPNGIPIYVQRFPGAGG